MLAFAIRHSHWNRIRVFLGNDAEERAIAFIVEHENNQRSAGCQEPALPGEIEQQLADGELDDWEVFDEALLDEDDETKLTEEALLEDRKHA